jgi:hypothetical protein
MRASAEKGMRQNTEYAFGILTALTLLSLYALLFWGAVDTHRPRAPSISAIIADDVRKLLLYVSFVCFFAISRTGLVFTSTFYKLKSPEKTSGNRCARAYRRCVRSERFPKAAAVFGSLQLSGFIFVAALSLNFYPTYHYAFTVGLAYMAGTLCELLLLLRRQESGHPTACSLALNWLVYVLMNVFLITYGALTSWQYYSETHTYSGLFEWVGFALMAELCFFRDDDIKHFKLCKCCEDND